MNPKTALPRILSALIIASLTPSSIFGSGYEFEGVGARQVARGGAAVADADDWTAVYWNPANIVRGTQKNGREVGLEAFGGMAYAKDSNSLSTLPGVGAIFSKDDISSGYVLGALGALIPLGSSAGLGLGFYTPLLQGVDFEDRSPTTGTTIRYQAMLAVATWNISASIAFSPEFSFGAGLNILYSAIRSDLNLENFPFPGTATLSHLKGDGLGLEGIFGARYDLSPRWTLGAVYRTGSNLTLNGSAQASSSIAPSESARFSYELKQPPTTAVGVAYRPTQDVTLSLDFDQTYWSGFQNSISYNPSGVLLATSQNTFQWRDTWKLRSGARYHFSEKNEAMAGYSYDRPAVDPGNLDLSTVTDVPMHRFYGGLSHRWNSHLENVLGGVFGVGTRTEQGVSYRLAGWQLMLEARANF